MKRSDQWWVSLMCWAGAAVTAALVLAGCGGSSSATGDTSRRAEVASASPTKAEFIKQGDAICRNTDRIQKKGIAAYIQQHPQEVKSVPDQEKIMIRVALPPIETEIQELAALGAPKGDEARVKAIISGLENALRAAELAPFTLLGTKGEGEFAKPDKLAGRYGFVDCAKAL